MRIDIGMYTTQRMTSIRTHTEDILGRTISDSEWKRSTGRLQTVETIQDLTIDQIAGYLLFRIESEKKYKQSRKRRVKGK